MPRYTLQAGIVLAAASLVSGHANSAASRTLEMTGRYVENAGMCTIEVASWLVEASSRGGLRRESRGFELTVRVRVTPRTGEAIAVPDTRVKHAIRVVGPVLGTVNRVIDGVPGTLPLRTALGERYRLRQDARLRARYRVAHDLVDAAPHGRPHPARGPSADD